MNKMQSATRELWLEITGGERDCHFGLDIVAAISQSDQLNSGALSTSLKNWLCVFDEFASWFVSLATCLYVWPKVGGRLGDEWRAFVALIGCIVSQLIAVRRLVLSGLDIPAKQVLRSIVEYLDVSVMLSLDNSLIGSFLSTEDVDQANGFWHRHISRGKSRAEFHKFVDSIITARGDEFASFRENMEEWRAYKKSEDTILSASTHPSLAAAFMSVTPSIGEPGSESEYWPGYFGRVGQVSVRTLKYASAAMLDYVLVGYVPDLDGIVRKTSDTFLCDLLQHVTLGRQVLVRLIMLAFQNQRHPGLAVDHDLSFLATDLP